MRSTVPFSRHAVPAMVAQKEGLVLMVSAIAGICGFAQGLGKGSRPPASGSARSGPGGVKTEFARGKGRTGVGAARSDMPVADDRAGAVLFAATRPPPARIIRIQMHTGRGAVPDGRARSRAASGRRYARRRVHDRGPAGTSPPRPVGW